MKGNASFVLNGGQVDVANVGGVAIQKYDSGFHGKERGKGNSGREIFHDVDHSDRGFGGFSSAVQFVAQGACLSLLRSVDE